MKTIFFFLCLSFPFYSLFAADCFIVKEGDKIISEGACSQKHSPASTFKIPLSLMGYNERILLDELKPEWPYKEEYQATREIWKQSHNPTTWIKNSCIWYSRLITQALEMDKLKDYLAALNYGNQDVSGDKGQNNGLTHSWLSSSLAISPEEQVAFLEKLINLQLPFSLRAQILTKNILFIETLPDAWDFFGKTGSGYQLNKDGSRNLDRQMGWFVGWLQKGDRKIIFAHYIEDQQKIDLSAGARAKEQALQKLMPLLPTLPN